MGYLGKISAIVSANTGDYVRKLNDSARTTTAFAKTVQSDLNKASSDARRSFDAILTPLQRFERAIQNAAGYKLKFRGADVAIQSIRDLTVLVSKLERQRDIDFAVKASGLKNITELKAALTSISQDSMDIVARVGLKGLVEARAKLDEIKEVDGQKITVVLDAKKAAEYDAAIEGINALGGQKAVEALIRVVGRDQLRQVVGLEKQLVSIAEEINRPLAQAAQRYYQMGAAIQVAFGPALKNAQGGVDGLKNSLDQGEKVSRSTFASVRKEALLTAAAINRIADAEEMAGRLAGGPARGRRPEFARAISRAETLQNAAIESSGGNFSGALSRQAAAARAVVVAMTKVEAAQRKEGADVAAANAEYKRRLAILVQIGDQIEKQLAAEKQRSAASKSRQDVAFAVTGKPQNIAQAEQAYNGLLGKVQQLELAQRKAFAPKLQALGSLVAAGDAAGLKDIRRLVAEIDRDLAKQKRLDVSTAEATKKIDDLKNRLRGVSDTLSGTVSDPFARLEASAERAKQAVEKVRDARRRASLEGRIARVDSANAADAANDSLTPRQLAARARRRAAQLDRIAGSAETKTPADVFGPAINSAARRLDVLRGSVSSVKSELDGLPAPIRRGFVAAIRDAEREFVRLSNAPAATAAAVARAEARVESLRRAVQRASASQTFAKDFGGAGQQGLNLGIDQRSLRGVGAQIEYLQGRLVGLSAVARGPVVAAMERVRQVAATGFRDGTIGTAAFNRQLQNATTNLTRVAAAALNVRPGRLAEQLRRVGDVARGSFGNMGLAIQQGVFAIDDFFSATGGLDQRIRAMANNISQMAFLLGGTWGLIGGVVLSASAQAVIGLMRWTGETERAEDRQRRLRLALESTNSALERQREIAASISDAYRDMARSIRESGLSERGRDELSRQQPMEEIKQKQAERRLAAIEANDPAVGRANAEIANIDERLRTEENAAERRRLLRQRRDAEERRRIAIETIESRGQQNAQVVLGSAGFDQALEQQERARASVRRQRARAEARGDDREAERLTRELAVIENTMQRIRDAAQNIGFAGADRAARAFGRAQQNISDIPGQTLSELAARQSQERVEKAINDFGAGRIDFNELRRVYSGEEALSRATEQASIALKAFAAAAENASGALAKTVEQESAQAAEQARRRANAAEAEFGSGDLRTKAARRDQEELEDRRRAVAEERAKIDEEVARQRESFERDALNGIGDPRAVEVSRRMQEIDSALATLPKTPEEVSAQNAMRAERERLERELEQIAERQPGVQDARRRADALDIRQQEIVQRQQAEARGLDLLETPEQRAVREARQGIADIVAATDARFSELADRNNGLPFAGQDAEAQGIREDRDAAIRRFVVDQMRTAAPAWFSMMEEVQDAVLSGPSRAALNASDASSVEGQRELNRLLRGEDSARDVNLEELRRQTQVLEEIAENTRDVAPVAN